MSVKAMIIIAGTQGSGHAYMFGLIHVVNPQSSFFNCTFVSGI